MQDFVCDLQVEASGVSGRAQKLKQVTAYFKLGAASANKGATRDMRQESYGSCCPTADGRGRGLVASVGAGDLSRPATAGAAPSEALVNLEHARTFHSDEWVTRNLVNVADFNQIHGGNTIAQSKKHKEQRSFKGGAPGVYHSNVPIRFRQELEDAQDRRVQVRTCNISVVSPELCLLKVSAGTDSRTLLQKNPMIKASTRRFVAEHQWLHRCLGCSLNLNRLQAQIEAVLPTHLADTLRSLEGDEIVVCTITKDDVPFPAPTASQEAKASLAATSALFDQPRSRQHGLDRWKQLFRAGCGGGSAASAPFPRSDVLAVGDSMPAGGVLCVDLVDED